ncbi:coiled-coil domain-containing protein 57 isoform X1 [Biomphalaria glabrata]|nr:coiled-coil domain-containing protein 57 isoform X1 [Biomphalaria glabrata]
MDENTSWRTLADQKEKEWRQVLESRIETLEKECETKDKALSETISKFNELKEHFKYNLKLLEDRDRELEKYDLSFAEIRNALNEKNAEISELKIHLDDLNNVIKREEKTKDELQANYQRRLREKQVEVDNYKSYKDKELLDERKEYEEFRRNLQRQLTNVQNELDIQKRELTMEFEDELKKREHEFKLRLDEVSTKALEYELKVKVITKELELARESHDKTTAVVEEVEDAQRKLEKFLKQKEWELSDVTAIKDAEISDLKNKLLSCEAAMKKMQEDFQRKFTEMDKMTRDKEELVERVKNGYREKEESLTATIQDLQAKLEDSRIRERQLQWSKEDLIKEKEMQTENLKEEIKNIKEKWDRHVAELSREHVNRDFELETALEEQRRLKLELDQRKEDLERYKNELKDAAVREEKLDKAKIQAELDWQRRCEDLERQQFDKSEDLIKRLTTARNDAEALLKERERELRHKVLLIKSLHRERDQLRTLLKKADIPLDSFTKYSLESVENDEEDLEYIEKLQKENSSLKELISHMRQEMEALGGEMPKSSSAKYSNILTDSDTFSEELQELRRENKELKQKLKDSRKLNLPTSLNAAPSLQDPSEVMTLVDGNTTVKNHILALNASIGNLRSEKVELAASVKKQQARIAFLENSLENISSQPRQKQIQIDQLTYELSTCRRRYEAEINGLKSRVADLELLLSEARREADEYHRASLERNEELVALGNQLSALKMEMAEANPSIHFGAQELYIQQLQSEISQLRRTTTAADESVNNFLESKLDKFSATDVKSKLKLAAAKIIQLAKENMQLTESNNRLRTELKVATSEKKPTKPSSNGAHLSVDHLKRPNYDAESKENQPTMSQHDRLAELEKLQYQLTKQELQFAQRFRNETTQDSRHALNNIEIPEKDMSESGDRVESPVYDFQPRKAKSTPPRPKSGGLSARQVDSHMFMSMSSGGGDSIQKVWELLEQESVTSGESTKLPSAQMVSVLHPRQSGEANDSIKFNNPEELILKGQKAELKSALRHPPSTAKVSVKRPTQARQKVRNYNVKDDSFVR